MKNLLAIFTLALLAGGLLMAEPAVAINRGTGGCGMAGFNADGNLIPGGLGQTSLVLENGNKVMLRCEGEGITNLTGQGQSASGFGCGIFTPDNILVFTTDSRTTVSASGRATLICTYSKKD